LGATFTEIVFERQGGELSYRNQNNGVSLFRINRQIFKNISLRKVHFVGLYYTKIFCYRGTEEERSGNVSKPKALMECLLKCGE
jgi:hypothetical protein